MMDMRWSDRLDLLDLRLRDNPAHPGEKGCSFVGDEWRLKEFMTNLPFAIVPCIKQKP
jgi:hypothetical protein